MKSLFIFFISVISILFLCNTEPIYALNNENLDIYSEYAILYNLDEDIVLYEKNSEVRTSIASLTKIMTVIVAIENIENLDNKVTLTYPVFRGLAEANASVAGFKIGETVSYRDLLMGALLPSGADATRALALNIAGSEDRFVELMNKKASVLGLENTNFSNTTGLESYNHYSTVKDISVILKYALKNKIFKQMYMTREYTTTNGRTFYSTLKKISNSYAIDVSNILGTKTGFTNEAGLCMSSIANYNGINYLLVTAGADYRGNTPRQLLDATNIYNYYSNNYGYKYIINKNDYITDIKIKYSKDSNYKILAPNSIKIYEKNDFDLNKVYYKFTGLNELSYKNETNETIGVVDIFYENQIIDTMEIYLTRKIEFDVISFLIQTNLIYIISFAILIILFLLIRRKRKKP